MEKKRKILIAIATINKHHNDIIKSSKYLSNYKIFLINKKGDLKKINKNISFIFFLHWRWRVDSIFLNKYNCICFHMTDLPFGRGGSPLQNLILNGHKETYLSAFKMTKKLDAGPIYLKRKIKLSGSADGIYKLVMVKSLIMINKIISLNISPKSQKGTVTYFERRKPTQSKMKPLLSLQEIYDFIRMLDAQDYPKAFIDYKSFTMLFNNAKMNKNKLTATVEFQIKKKKTRVI